LIYGLVVIMNVVLERGATIVTTRGLSWRSSCA